MLSPGKKIFLAGHRGMVGSALHRALLAGGSAAGDILTAGREELDLCNQAAVAAFVEHHRPDIVIIAAAKVGGIVANDTFPADFLYDNLAIASNLIHSSFQAGVDRLLFLGSSCIYPKHARQPIREDALLTGPLEATNEAYALAKIAGLKLCEYYRRQHGRLFHSAMPCNLYGPGDNYHPTHSHVIPGLIRRFHEAKISGADSVTIWGSGKPLREFLHVDDLAAACLQLLDHHDPPSLVNVGAGHDLPIRELAELIATTVGFTGTIHCDPSRPDGTPRKLMDSTLIHSLGWTPRIALPQGLAEAYQDFLTRFGE